MRRQGVNEAYGYAAGGLIYVVALFAADWQALQAVEPAGLAVMTSSGVSPA